MLQSPATASWVFCVLTSITQLNLWFQASHFCSVSKITGRWFCISFSNNHQRGGDPTRHLLTILMHSCFPHPGPSICWANRRLQSRSPGWWYGRNTALNDNLLKDKSDGVVHGALLLGLVSGLVASRLPGFALIKQKGDKWNSHKTGPGTQLAGIQVSRDPQSMSRNYFSISRLASHDLVQSVLVLLWPSLLARSSDNKKRRSKVCISIFDKMCLKSSDQSEWWNCSSQGSLFLPTFFFIKADIRGWSW